MSDAENVNDEWVQTGPNRLERPLRGAELMVNVAEQEFEGNYQLAFSCYVNHSFSDETLRARLPTAWYKTRLMLPEIGVKVLSPEGELDTAFFDAITTWEEARDWVNETIKIVNDGTNVDEVVDRCAQGLIKSRGKQTVIYFVCNARNGRNGFVWNGSHCLTGHRGILNVVFLLKLLADPDSATPLSEAFDPEELESIIPRLPQSMIRAYEKKFPATDEDVEAAFATQQVVSSRFEKESIGIPVQPNWRERPSKMSNLRFSLDWNESRRALATLKPLGITLTTAFYACLVSAITQMFGKESNLGAHLMFSAHGKRWFKTDGEDGDPPIGMAIVPSGAWVDKKEIDLAPTELDGLVRLAKKIAKEQEHDLRSPHVIGTYDLLAQGFAAAVPEMKQQEPTYSRPVLTSQAEVLFPMFFGTTQDWIKWTDFTFAGRNTDPTVCFALHTGRAMIRFVMVFDERYFDPKEMQQLGSLVSILFSRFHRVSKVPALVARL